MANYLASSAAAELGSLVHLDNGSDASSEDDDFLLEDIGAYIAMLQTDYATER
eukprot:CAMPEP_0114264760 /NCGR_PEP_ID=MMETSP0058-20121206/23416_1 /TAXON_ID=36894 /ORGANISM="Pyramimonas parkeae, CCMP726" /LENGTH=52 /DNA_ID=CAMNT_0001381531 /DNA_START=103 /DNA_END=261 /DNA_ORIENTATION=+